MGTNVYLLLISSEALVVVVIVGVGDDDGVLTISGCANFSSSLPSLLLLLLLLPPSTFNRLVSSELSESASLTNLSKNKNIKNFYFKKFSIFFFTFSFYRS